MTNETWQLGDSKKNKKLSKLLILFLIISIVCVSVTIWTYKESIAGDETVSDSFINIPVKLVPETPNSFLQTTLEINLTRNVQLPEEQSEKQLKIKEMMLHAWTNYKQFAWGKNELRPISKMDYKSSVFGDREIGATIVDAMDTLYIMGLTKEFEEGRAWVAANFSFENVDANISVFETNIRFVGGFLSCYALTGDKLFKEKARLAADKLLPAFETPTGVPLALVNFKTGFIQNHHWTKNRNGVLSEFGTMSLEFSYLSDVTDDSIYREKVEKIRTVLKNMEKPTGLYPNFFNNTYGIWGNYQFSLGAFGDSFYEYLLKSWLQSGQTNDEERKVFDDAMEGILKYMTRKSKGGLTYITEKIYSQYGTTMSHLACFSGGLFALAAHTKQNNLTAKYLEMAEEITKTCHESYVRSPIQLGPEIFRFNDQMEAKTNIIYEQSYLLRPELVESYFIMWRFTKDQKYRDWGWDVVMALEKYCRVENGYSGIRNVYADKLLHDDIQQSYFLAETLKYLYLLFSDDSLLPLDKWVFNTEAHPFPIKTKKGPKLLQNIL